MSEPLLAVDRIVPDGVDVPVLEARRVVARVGARRGVLGADLRQVEQLCTRYQVVVGDHLGLAVHLRGSARIHPQRPHVLGVGRGVVGGAGLDIDAVAAG